MSDSEHGPRPVAVEELAELVMRASALRGELDAIKAQSAVALFVHKLRNELPTGERPGATSEPRPPSGDVSPSGSGFEQVAAELRGAVAALTSERAAIARESALGLFVRRLLGKMPPAGALPIFSRERLVRLRLRRAPSRALERIAIKSGRIALQAYRRARIRPCTDPITDLYYVTESRLAIAYPAIEHSALLPAGNSPYREYAPKGYLPTIAFSRHFPLNRDRHGDEPRVDRTCETMLSVVRATGRRRSDRATFLNVGSADASLLDRLRATTSWRVTGIETDLARAGSAFPVDERFDIVRLGGIEGYNDPVAAIAAVRSLLVVGGLLVLATPNLDSAQIDMFGPTWSGWRPPYHHFVFNLAALRLLAARTNMRLAAYRTTSDPDATAQSLVQRRYGLVPDGFTVPADLRAQARSICSWSQLLFDPRGRGDRIVAVLEKRG